MQLSITVRNARADAFETAVGASAMLRQFDGAMPADCATASAGTKVAEGALPADWMAAAANGTKAKNGVWTVTGSANGLMRYWRLFDSTGTTCHAQGIVSQPHAVSTPVVLNQQMHNAGNVYKCTTAGNTGAASPPTGTGVGIADGTAVWAYVGPVEMTTDNTNIANAQVATVNSFNLTEANA